jgi:hypothetical protein
MVVTLYRVAYPIEAAQKKILDAGLPPMLAYRLGWDGNGLLNRRFRRILLSQTLLSP